MNVTQRLKDEHQLILKYVALLDRYLRAMRSNAAKRTSLAPKLYQFISFIQEFADKYHHAKEENILFQYMERPHVLAHCNPLPQMLYEHDNGRTYVQEMIAALEKNEIESAITSAYGWLHLLSDHIHKEDNILYPMGEEGLNEEDKQEILKDYAQAEEKHRGAELEAKYRALLSDLERELEHD
ncbi:MAG: hemerythrin domain-containing protein [Oligoflexia bacterium]|nr:hemerythrin domain-containing protein [Oligoflexia bacterium]